MIKESIRRIPIFLYLVLAIFSSYHSFSQNQADSSRNGNFTDCHLRISLLTASPGQELYSTFGHTAIRVIDSMNRQDIVFNYGTFDFEDPSFYTKFVRGKLNYFLSVESFADFQYSFQVEQRSVVEQNLRITCQEKQKLLVALQENAREENKYYKYDFLFDNCTTRARDIIVNQSDKPVIFKNILPADIPTFRHLIHSYLHKSGQYWSKLGIDILMGIKVDQKVTNLQAMFLPDYLMKGFDSARINNQPLADPSVTVLQSNAAPVKGSWLRPEYVFTLLLVAIAALQFSKPGWARQALNIFDHLFFFAIGSLGILMVFMWTGTDHVVCRNNFNLFWALPTHLPMAFFLQLKKNWVQKYFQVIFWICILMALTWFFIPQQLNIAIAPILLIIIARSHHLSKAYD